jgi:glycosyltransferase involved in cell wall biosynthesis
MVEDLSLENNVEFTGFAEDDEVVRLLNSSKLFVFPSRKEGFAQAVSQAMGCGLCCLLSDIPPLKEVYGGAAVFCTVEQPQLLAQAIRHLLGAEEERRLYSERARRLAESFSWESTVREEISPVLRLAEHS